MTDKELCCGKTFKEVMKEVEFHISDKQRIAKFEKENAELKKHRDKLLKKSIIDFQKIDELEKENTELKADKEYLERTDNEQTEVILMLQDQIEKMKTFIHSEIDFCMYCPLTNECKNDEGICPYAYATEEEQKKLLMDFINKWEIAE